MQYKAPLRDMKFVMHELLKFEDHYKTIPSYAHTDKETIDSFIEAGASFSEAELSPLNRSGDEEGCRFENGNVYTPKGFKEAYKQYCELGFPSLCADEEFGGQGMPLSLGSAVNEMVGTANWSFSMYPGLSEGAIRTLEHHGTDEQKQKYLLKLVSGEWTGTMCLTEPHAGTDLGIIKTKAVPNQDGSYNITGTKIFITAGEHDLADNIIHLVLAKTPDAPAGSRGISLFIVPKFHVNADGSLGERNAVSCGSIEHKMGIKASATCVMNFDGAKGFMVGAENTGLASMFIMMNYERLTMGLQGIGGAELAYQNATAYTLDRIQGRADSGIQEPNKAADPIVFHADVRRMLLNAKTISEASRCFAMYVAKELDTNKYTDDDAARKAADDRVALLTPVAKAFLTDRGLEASIDAQQCFGGHGYIREWGMEQIVRDTRISQIYEGTNGIQSLDLLGRKVVKNGGAFVTTYVQEMRDFANNMNADHAIKQAILTSADKLEDLTKAVVAAAAVNKDEINGCAVDYLQAFGYVSFAYMFGLMVEAANGKEGDFYANKAKLADYYVGRMLPRLDAHIAMVKATSQPITAFDRDYFAATIA